MKHSGNWIFGKQLILVFNKIDAFSYTAKDKDDLTPVTRENYSLADLKNTWMASDRNHKTIFISAKTRENIPELQNLLFGEVKSIHITRYPYNGMLLEK
jgi:GTP-binding protein HflX